MQNSLLCDRSICTNHSVCLNIGFWYRSFIWKWCVFNLSAFNSETVLEFFEVFCYPRNLFESYSIQTFKIFTDCDIKTSWSLKRRAILKIPSTVFLEGPMPFLLVLKWNFWEKAFFGIKTKKQSKFCRKTCWKEQPFIFNVYLMNHIFKTSVLFSTW